MNQADETPNLHSCRLRGISWSVGDPDEGDWTSELTLDVDYLAEWICVGSDPCRFRVAPAQVVFSGVTDLKVHLAWGTTGFQVSVSDAVIWSVDKRAVAEQKIFLDRPYYAWRIELQSPEGGEISFGATTCSVRLLSQPILKDQPRLSLKERSSLISRGAAIPSPGQR